MKVTSLKLSEFRAFRKLSEIHFNQVNVLIGPNNAGKSSILKALYCLQSGVEWLQHDVRIGTNNAEIEIGINDQVEDRNFWPTSKIPIEKVAIKITTNDERSSIKTSISTIHNSSRSEVNAIEAKSPSHFVIPLFSKRKAISYQENVSENYSQAVIPNFQYLAAKLSVIGNSSHPCNTAYTKACKEILGFSVTAIPSNNGQKPGIYLSDGRKLGIDQLGEGVPNIVGMLAEITLAKNKLFLIEEPENDLHPKALKALLELILESSASNQFVISTHSNIVLKILGSHEKSRIFQVSQVPETMPQEASVREIENSPQARLNVLSDLGYNFTDLELWEGWLILEESSAERVIRDYLIPWFAPKLTRMRTISSSGVDRVEPNFEDFRRLICFAHLEQAYKTKTYVRVDNDEPGKKVISKLREKFPSWPSEHFGTFEHEQFEEFYPAFFQKRVQETLGISNRYHKRQAKQILLNEVRAWLDEDQERGKAALAESAASVIEFLQNIEENF